MIQGPIRVLFFSLAASVSSFAVISDSPDDAAHLAAPTAGISGWDYVGTVNGASGVYLGSYAGAYWVITAAHVGGGSFTIGNTPYSMVPGSGMQIGSLDLYVFQITVDGTSSLLDLPNLAISSATPALGTEVMMIGNGQNRATSLTAWYVDVDTDPYSWSDSPTADTDGVAYGYQYTAGRNLRWGTDTLESVTNYAGTNFLVTDFDVNGSTVADGDSGGGMFYYSGTEWVLAGILDLKGTISGQPAGTAVFGDTSYAINLATYRSQILSVIPEPSSFLLLGMGAALLALGRRRG